MYGRIDLSKTNYYLDNKIKLCKPEYEDALRVYTEYCNYKNFSSVYPLYKDDLQCDIHCLYVENRLIAFQKTEVYINDKVAFHDQFAWDYSNPKDEIGWRFYYHTCAFYKQRGYSYLYIGEHQPHKLKLCGYEIMGKLK